MTNNKQNFYMDAVNSIKTAILKSRYLAARLANAEQLKLYFSIGGYVSANTRHGKWGSGAIEAISRQLQAELPGLRGFSATSIRYMRLFYESWAADGNEIHHLASDELLSSDHHSTGDDFPVLKLSGFPLPAGDELSANEIQAFLAVGFTHHRYILAACKEPEERWYYILQCASRFWSVETLKAHLQADDYHRLGTLPNNFALTMPDEKQAARAVRAFKDEYLLDYINIEDASDDADVDERVLETELVGEIKRFIQSLGADFCFVGNQYRIIVEDREFFVDLLFYHRALRSLVAVELKRGEFTPAYLGELNFYLSALDDKVRHPDENRSIGLLLCQKARRGIVELAVRDFNKPMGVAVYRLNSEIPQPYQSLIPLIDGVEKILNRGAENE